MRRQPLRRPQRGKENDEVAGRPSHLWHLLRMLPIETIRLTDGKGEAWIAPARGGMVTRLSIGGEDVLYLDEASLGDPSKNVRGGIPILFPIGGKVKPHRLPRSTPPPAPPPLPPTLPYPPPTSPGPAA